MNTYKGIKPTLDRVLIEPQQIENMRKSGLVVPPQHSGNDFQYGIVRAVGPGKLNENGKRQPMPPLIGEKVVFNAFKGIQFKHDDVHYLIMREGDIMAILKGKIKRV